MTTKFNSSGSGILYSTYIGGNKYDVGNGIAVDSSGNAYVAGGTSSTDFPGTNLGTLTDGFILKLNPTGTGLIYSLRFGAFRVEW